jgi:oligogalacturonide transport system substrate-binding protein
MKKNKCLSVIFMLVLLFFSTGTYLFANGSKEDTGSTQEEADLRMSWWGGNERHEATLAVIDLYTEQNPHVTIEAEYGGYSGHYQKLITQIAGGTAPDLMVIANGWIPEFVNKETVFLNLNKYPEIINTDGYEQKFLQENCVYGNVLTGLPLGFNASTMVYNADFMKSYSVDASQPWDWERLIEVGEKIHQTNPEQYLLNVDNGTIRAGIIRPYLRQLTGKRWVQDDYTLGFGKTEATKALSLLKELFDKGVIQPYNELVLFNENADKNPKWLQGEIGMIFALTSQFNSLQGSVDAELGVTNRPIKESAPDSGIEVKPATILSVYQGSEHPEEAAEFVNFFVNDVEAGLILGTVRSVPAVAPVRKALVEKNKIDPRLVRAVDIAVAKAGMPLGNLETNETLQDKILQNIIEEVAFDVLAPEEAAVKLIKQIEEQLQEMKEGN